MAMQAERFSRENLFGDHLLGQRFVASGREYMLAGKVGDGAIGVVRKATDLETDRIYAIKFLAPEQRFLEASSLDDIYRRFKREGERGENLDHDNLVKIIAFEENENGGNFSSEESAPPQNPFIIMEFVHGRTLEAFLKKHKDGVPKRNLFIVAETLYIAYEVTKALVYLHRNSLVHRDVKPANIFISRTSVGQIPRIVKLGDFGVVKWGDYRASISTGTLTTTGHRGLGTLKYMAPEQSLDPQNVEFKSDMYSFGITLFELFFNYILPDIHHVIQIRDIRMEKGNVISRLHTLGIPFPTEFAQYEYLLETVFDCFLKRSGRPTSTKLKGLLKMQLEKFPDITIWDD